MTWVKLDDQFTDHPKVVKAGPLAAWLYVCGLTYCGRYLTDGHIPAQQVRRLADLPDTDALAERLVAVGLWERCEDGFRVHDWADYNPSADETRSLREKRAEAGRLGGSTRRSHIYEAKAQASAKQALGALPLALTKQNSTPSPSPSPYPDPNPDLSLTSASAPPIARELSDSWRLCACAALERERLKPWELTALAAAEAAGYSLAALSWSLARAALHARSPTGRVAYALSCIADAPTNHEETDPDAQEPARRLRADPRHSDARGEVRPAIDVGDYERLYVDAATYHVPDVPGPGPGESAPPESNRREHPGV